MIKLKIEIDGEKRKFELPNGWDEVTVGQYKQLMMIDRDNLTSVMQFVKMITILSDIDEDTVMQIPATSFGDIQEALDFTKEIISTDDEIKDYIIVGDDKYYIKKDFEALTMGETISIEATLEKHKNKLELALPELLCIFLRKKKDNGKLESFKASHMERAELFEGIIISDINQLFLFFSSGKN